jgi:hypothetical protein
MKIEENLHRRGSDCMRAERFFLRQYGFFGLTSGADEVLRLNTEIEGRLRDYSFNR